MFVSLPKTTLAQTLGRQVLRSGTSVAANVREASRARSKKEFLAKLSLAEQELDESLLWLEMLVEGGVIPQARLASLHQEGEEILKIIVATIKTSKKRAAG